MKGRGPPVTLVWVDRHRTRHTAEQAIEIAKGPSAGYVVAAVVPWDRQLENRINKILDDGSGV